MRLLVPLFLLISLTLPATHGLAQPSSSTAYDEVLTAIEMANSEINRLIKAGKFAAAGQYFAEDVIQLVSGQPPITSRAAWIATQRGASQIGEWDLQLEVLELEVRDDIAVERGHGVQTFTANENSPMPSFESVGDYMVLWKKVDDGWKIQWDYVVLQQPDE
jgi:ketosteroid isomerase-like protein